MARSGFRCRVPMEYSMDIRVSLEYPNGRVHEATIERDTPLEPGQEFQMHGRHWRAVSRTARRGRLPAGRDAPMLCRSS